MSKPSKTTRPWNRPEGAGPWTCQYRGRQCEHLGWPPNFLGLLETQCVGRTWCLRYHAETLVRRGKKLPILRRLPECLAAEVK